MARHTKPTDEERRVALMEWAKQMQNEAPAVSAEVVWLLGQEKLWRGTRDGLVEKLKNQTTMREVAEAEAKALKHQLAEMMDTHGLDTKRAHDVGFNRGLRETHPQPPQNEAIYANGSSTCTVHEGPHMALPECRP